MRLAALPVREALGALLVHNVPDDQGHKALAKGRRLTPGDLDRLIALGRTTVYVAQLDPDDVHEDAAAARIAAAVAGPGLQASRPSGGRVNLTSSMLGLFKVNRPGLLEMNRVPGVTLSTLPGNRVVPPKKLAATVKTIGLSLPEKRLDVIESFARASGPVLSLLPLNHSRVAVILTGDSRSRARVEQTFLPAIRSRVEALGGELVQTSFAAEQAEAIAAALQGALGIADCIILAGETSIMDADDVTPRGIKQAGGEITLFGAPVEPGNLLLLAYCDRIPIIGAPGCVKSKDVNVVDLVLPRLLAGEHVSRDDILELADGGLLI